MSMFSISKETKCFSLLFQERLIAALFILMQRPTGVWSFLHSHSALFSLLLVLAWSAYPKWIVDNSSPCFSSVLVTHFSEMLQYFHSHDVHLNYSSLYLLKLPLFISETSRFLKKLLTMTLIVIFYG